MSGGSFQPKVCVTGANGFLGTHIVSQCLAKGYRVCGTVRNAHDQRKIEHLLQLDGASTHLEIFSAEMLPESSCGFREAFDGCTAVFHTAAPGTRNPMVSEDVHAAVLGTLSVLRSCKAAGVKTVVMTSGVCAASPENATVISEKDWSNPKQQVQINKYTASKTLAEWAAWQYMKEEPGFRFVTILPSTIVGPSLSSDLCATNKSLLTMLKNGLPGGICPDDSLSFVDVRDCAAHHIVAMEQETTNGRVFSTAASWHWNELGDIMKQINPKMPTPRKCSKSVPQPCFDLTRQNELGVEINEIPDILRDAAEHFKKLGVREATTFIISRPCQSDLGNDRDPEFIHVCSELQRYAAYNEFGLPGAEKEEEEGGVSHRTRRYVSCTRRSKRQSHELSYTSSEAREDESAAFLL